MKTCIIIPCYNEEKRLPKVDFLSFIEDNDIDFCFINDGSTDKTREVLNAIKNKAKDKIVLIDYKINLGKAEAIRKATLYLYEKYNYAFIGYFDADLATPLFEIKNLQKQFLDNQELLFVMGSRFKRLGANIDRKFNRFLFGRIFATIVSSFVLNMPVYDTQCGAKLFSTKIPKHIFEEKFLTKWFFDVELLFRLKNNYRQKIIKYTLEYPLKEWIEKGESKIKFLDFLNTPIEILRIYKKYK